jgi:hypothetical protein
MQLARAGKGLRLRHDLPAPRDKLIRDRDVLSLRVVWLAVVAAV